MLIAALNGARGPREHPRLPVTAEHLAQDAAAVRAEGASGVHVHIKNAAGADTLTPAPLAAALLAIRAAAPGLPISVTTGAWAQPVADARVGLIESWSEQPDSASVNWHEEGAERLAGALLDRGVAVEAGLWRPQDVVAFLRWGRRSECRRVLLELPARDPAVTVRLADFLLAQLRAAEPSLPVQMHGEGASAWPALRHAARLGLETRIGLEDTLLLPDGTEASGNPELVRAALAAP